MANPSTDFYIKLTPTIKKDIETGEGILVYVTNAIIYLAAILPHGLSWTHAALFVTILNAVHVFQRGLQKVVLAGKDVGIVPIEPPLPKVPAVPGETTQA